MIGNGNREDRNDSGKASDIILFINFLSFKIAVCSRGNFIKRRRNSLIDLKTFFFVSVGIYLLRIAKHPI